ncbi:hypothetical protein K3495_g2684 [Podosphaera aphanis]|nr:hypothetical protein K3495_g2684 [Podosphaera aphanis]
MPYNGKKTVPAALRKDLWSPLATINFPQGSGPIGLSVFQKLREYRKRHEQEWGDEIAKNPENGYFIAKKLRGRLLCDQVANSVADMAYVLGRLKAQNPDKTEEGNNGKELKISPKRPKGGRQPQPRLFPKPPPGGIGLIGEGTGLPVEVFWKDVKMAEYAETWTDNVVHGILSWSKNNRDNKIGNSKRKLLRIKEEQEYINRKNKRMEMRKMNDDHKLAGKEILKSTTSDDGASMNRLVDAES